MAINNTNIRVEGLSSTIDRLRLDYSWRGAKNRLRNAARKEFKDIRRDMKKAAPTDERKLRKSIRISSKFTNNPGIRLVIGPNLKKAHHAHWVELGTKAHKIKLRPHPGTKAQPYVKPTYDKHKASIPARVLKLVNRLYNL